MKVLMALFLSVLFVNAQETINMKSCEKIQLSKLTVLFSCHQVDYIIKYKYEVDEEKDNIDKITIITAKDKKILIRENKK